MPNDQIVTIAAPADEKFLRRKTIPFLLSGKGLWTHGEKSFSRVEISALLAHMKKMMHLANGVGLSANQIGLEYRLFVAQVPDAQGRSKFYAVFNPELQADGKDKEDAEEGCLSVPGVYGAVTRAARVTLKGFDRNGRPLKIKAWGLLARVFQHEVDHLEGTLFIDKAKNLEKTPTSERLAAREKRIRI